MVGSDSELALVAVGGRGSVVGTSDVMAMGEEEEMGWLVLGGAAETSGKMWTHWTGMYVMHASTLYSSINSYLMSTYFPSVSLPVSLMHT